MSIFSRIFKIGQAKANNIVDSLEKPELMLEQAIRDQEDHIRDVKKSVQSVIATERRTKALLDTELSNKTSWEKKAKSALSLGKDDLATKALTRSEEHENNAASLKPQWESQRKEVENLKVTIRKMDAELADLKRNKDIIIAQSKAAEVKKEIYEAKAKIGKNNTSDLIERMKNKAQTNVFEAEAAEEMAEDSSGDALEKEFADLGDSAASQSVQDKLAKLKGEMA